MTGVTHTRPRTIPVTWIAAADLIAHAAQGRMPRTLCGLPTLRERFGWPGARKCADCRSALEALEVTRCV